ncbi:ankyrin repeat and MYND domain-containing protein 2-like [Clytia hemisphaerica]|uniref:MYND-type domain-containing protein n=1 Tax=Clytia hemisphaerica TaxID=252671 RepID=A0A7M5VEY6_9CNID|eukprot:TCONS_00005377-protein
MATEEERKFLQFAKTGDFDELKNLLSVVDVNHKGEEGMTALMYAAYKGSVNSVELLLHNGADPNIDSTKDKYTPLMFATLSGSTDTVRTLLQAGAKPDAVNTIKRTAAQLGAFVGRHDCVSVINNFVQTDQIKYYTKTHGFEKTAKLDDKLAENVHKMVVIPNLNPVKLVLYIQDHIELIPASKEVLYVLETEVEKSFKDVNEVLSIKLHIFSHVFKKCVAWETGKEGKQGIKGLLKFLLKGRPADGFLLNIEFLLRDSMRSFPYAQSNLFKQIIKSLSSTELGKPPSAITILTQSINGMQSADFSECCTCCGDRHCFNKCSACKMVRYCNAACQKLHWSSHKPFCADLKVKYEELQRIQKLEKEQEEKAKLEKERLEMEKEKSQIEELETEKENETKNFEQLEINGDGNES